jgi:hypothetical protein
VQLDGEWKALMQRVPKEEAEEVAADYAKATADEKKRMVWDVRNFLDEQEGEVHRHEARMVEPGPPASRPCAHQPWPLLMARQEGEEEEDPEGGSQPPPKGPSGRGAPPKGPPPTDAEMGGRSEVRRRGGGAGRGREYERSMELGIDEEGRSRDGGEWDEYYSKEVRKSQKGRGMLMYGGACVMLSVLALVLTATALRDEDESVAAATLRLLHLA